MKALTGCPQGPALTCSWGHVQLYRDFHPHFSFSPAYSAEAGRTEAVPEGNPFTLLTAEASLRPMLHSPSRGPIQIQWHPQLVLARVATDGTLPTFESLGPQTHAPVLRFLAGFP